MERRQRLVSRQPDMRALGWCLLRREMPQHGIGDDQILALGHHRRVMAQFIEHMRAGMVGIQHHHDLCPGRNFRLHFGQRFRTGGWPFDQGDF